MEASDMRYSDMEDAALDDLLATARQVADGVSAEYQGRGLVLGIDVDLQAGGEGQPILVFKILLSLDDDFAAEDWPGDAVAEVKRRLRSRVQGSPVDAIEWFVFVSTHRESSVR